MIHKENKIKKDIKEYNKIIEKCNKNIFDLKSQKYKKSKNIFLTIISFNFYNWNKKIKNKINENQFIIKSIKEKILQGNKNLSKIQNEKKMK